MKVESGHGSGGEAALASPAEIGERLAAALNAVVDACPGSGESVSEFSRRLGIGRAICQRVVLCTRSGRGEEALLRVPGTRGVEMFIAAAARAGVGRALLDDARRALAMYEQLVSDAGGSQARLLDRLGRNAVQPAGPSDRTRARGLRLARRPVTGEAARRLVWEGMCGVTGQRAEGSGRIDIVRPLPHDPESIEIIGASITCELECDADAMPVVRALRLTSAGDGGRPEARAMGSNAFSDRPDGVIEAFSSPGLPAMGSRQTQGQILQILNLDGLAVSPVTVATGHWFSPAGPHPRSGERPYRLNIKKVFTVPSRAMTIDVYLERTMAAACVPEVRALRVCPRGLLENDDQLEDRWYDLLPDDFELVLLGRGLARRSPASCPRMRELTAHLFKESGLNPDQFVGYRVEVAYPLPDVGYIMSFDFEP